jgi:hypothetical protein
MSERRIPCVQCGTLVLEGARKCRGCKAWIGAASAAQPPRPAARFPRAAVIVTTSVLATAAVLISSGGSQVGEAPPLTVIGAEPAGATSAPAPAGIGAPEPELERAGVGAPEAPARWRVKRDVRLGDVHPLDVVWHPNGNSFYVSSDDASVREYRVKNGAAMHQASVPAQGDSIRLLFGRWLAVLRKQDAARIPVLDTQAWDKDPVLLDVGPGPGDIVELPDGKSVVAATTDGKRVTRFELPGGRRVANITLPHATGQLFLLRAEGRPLLAAMGAFFQSGRPAGAWIDVFDPSETPFGATRRSISAGREPREGEVTADGTAIFFPDRVSNTATLLRIGDNSDARQTAVGQSPEAGFLLGNDRWGITINSAARTATVIDLSTMTVSATLMLAGSPTAGATSPDRKTLFVSLGGATWPPRGSGVAVISGDPPRVVASLATGEGAAAVSVSKDGAQVAVANYWDRSVTILER